MKLSGCSEGRGISATWRVQGFVLVQQSPRGSDHQHPHCQVTISLQFSHHVGDFEIKSGAGIDL